MQAPELEMIRDIPGYKVILKAVIKNQIQQLVCSCFIFFYTLYLIILSCFPTDRLKSGSAVCHSICIFWAHYTMVKPECTKLRIIQKLVGCPFVLGFYSTLLFFLYSIVLLPCLLQSGLIWAFSFQTVCLFCA